MYLICLYRNVHYSLTHILSRARNVCKYSSNQAQFSFKGKVDRYKGVTIDSSQEKCEENTFIFKLEESLNQWITLGYRCVWFKVHIKDASFVPVLAQKGFNFHHARDDFVMMYKWMVDSEPNLPPACHTNLGVGAMVFNDRNQILAISEKHYEYPHWKLPGGYVERGEDIVDAAVREVKEETGVEATFQSLVTFRHTHNMMFGNSDIFALLRMKATMDEITISHREIDACKWMEIDEYVNHPHVHQFNRFVIEKALDYKNKKLKLDLQKKTAKWANIVRVMDVLVVEDLD